jgi:hypothetical protein
MISIFCPFLAPLAIEYREDRTQKLRRVSFFLLLLCILYFQLKFKVDEIGTNKKKKGRNDSPEEANVKNR